MDKSKNFKLIVLAILILAAFLRFYNIQHGDPLGDEADYGYRSYGLLDYESSPSHTTPLEWYDPNPLPIWLRVSFHDAPPLFFLTQHLSFKIFGENTFSLRFPSAIFGIGTVFLIIVLGELLYSKSVGLLAGVLTAISVNSIYISRVGMIDSMTIFFIVLTLVLYRKGLQNSWYFILMGMSLGLGLMTKYTAIIAGCIICMHMFFFQRNLFMNKKIWMGVFLSLIIFSPVIVYNIYLFKSHGHLDYAFMNMLGPVPDVWAANPGRDIGTIPERIIKLIPKTFAYGFWGVVLFFYFSLLYLFWRVIHGKKIAVREHSLLLLSFSFVIIFLILLGPSPRFVAMARPLFALISAYTFVELYQRLGKKNGMLAILGAVIIMGIIFDVNTFFIPDPVGIQYLSFGRLHFRQDNLGYVELDEYFRKELENKMPAYRKKTRYEFIDRLQEKTQNLKTSLGYEPQASIIVLDPNMDPAASLFIFGKLKTYHGWPVMAIQSYLAAHKAKTIPPDMICYYASINPRSYIKTTRSPPYSDFGYGFEKSLLQSHISPISVKDWSGNDAFHLYKWLEKTYTLPIQ